MKKRVNIWKKKRPIKQSTLRHEKTREYLEKEKAD